MNDSLDEDFVPDSNHGESRAAHAPPTGAHDGGLTQPCSAFPTASTSPQSADERVRKIWIWAVCGFLLLAVGLVFGQTVRHEFLGFDDKVFVSENPHVAAGLTASGIWWALTDGPFGEWYPLSTLSDMLDCQLYGLNPAGHYLTNVLLHAASSVLLFLVLLRMTGDLWPSAWVAAVFAIHPLHVESVAWLAERRDVLSGLFFMLTLGAYSWYAERPSASRYLAVGGCFALGLMSKPMLVTVPFLLLLLDVWPLNRFRRPARADEEVASGSWLCRLPISWRLVLEKIPLLALAALSIGIVLSSHMSLRSGDKVERWSLSVRAANALVSYAAYLGQSIYPVGLAAYYPHPGTRLSIAWAIASVLLLAAITLVALYSCRSRPYLPVGWFWFLGMLVPVVGLVPVAAHARADRYTYLSQIGLSIALAWGVWSTYRLRQSVGATGWRQSMLAVAAGAAVIALAAMAWRQTSYWHDAETLWTHTISCTERNAVAQYELAVRYYRQGRINDAITHLREALAADAFSRQVTAETHGLLGDCLTTQGKTEEALAHYEEAVHVFPTDVRSHTRLALAFARTGQNDRSIAEWRGIVGLDPTFCSARIGLANALLAGGEAGEAVVQCSEILKQQPGAIEATAILGAALAAEGQVEIATPYLKRALELQPSDARSHFYLGLALYNRGQSRDAIAHLTAAIQLQPDSVPMLWQTAWILATSPDPSIRNGVRAVELAKRAAQQSGGKEPQALDSLAAALAETNDYSAAAEAAEQASAIARSREDNALANAIEQRARLYRQSLPYRQSASRLSVGHAPAAAE